MCDRTPQQFPFQQSLRDKLYKPNSQSANKTPVLKSMAKNRKDVENSAGIADSAAALKNLQKSKIPVCSSHAASHLNSNTITPINNRKILSTVNGSANKLEPEKKSLFSASKTNKQIDAIKTNTPAINGVKSTPINRHQTSILHNSVLRSAKKDLFDINPVFNGVNYSDIMSKKAEYGYMGSGYVVEFDCDVKYLKGIQVPKGLWKVHASKNQKKVPYFNYPNLTLKRIDEVQETQELLTPLKIINELNFTPLHANIGSVEKTIVRTGIEHLNLDGEQKIKKKTIKWADSVLTTKGVQSPVPIPILPHLRHQYDHASPLATRFQDPMNKLDAVRFGKAYTIPEDEEDLRPFTEQDYQFRTARKMRRSFSTSDVANLILAQDEEDDDCSAEHSSSTDPSKSLVSNRDPLVPFNLPPLKSLQPAAPQQSEQLNVTYEKSAQLSTNHFHVYLNISPGKIVNSSFIDGNNPTLTESKNSMDKLASLVISPAKSDNELPQMLASLEELLQRIEVKLKPFNQPMSSSSSLSSLNEPTHATDLARFVDLLSSSIKRTTAT